MKMPRRKKEDELPPDQKGPPRGAANARERTRMRVLSKAFGRLKLTLPWVPPDTKLSKLDTLRLATSYISHLKTLLESDDEDDFDVSDNDKNDRDNRIDSSIRTKQLTSLRCWPYGQHRLLSATLAPSTTRLTTSHGRGMNGDTLNTKNRTENSVIVTPAQLTESSNMRTRISVSSNQALEDRQNKNLKQNEGSDLFNFGHIKLLK